MVPLSHEHLTLIIGLDSFGLSDSFLQKKNMLEPIESTYVFPASALIIVWAKNKG